MKFVIFCPDYQTGGPFALLQLNKTLCDLGIRSEVLFYDKGSIKKDDNMNSYCVNYNGNINLQIPNLPYDVCNEFDENSIIVLPETLLGYATKFYELKHPRIVYWWLSWDNIPQKEVRILSNMAALQNCIHIFQSHYARNEANALGFDGPIVSDYTITNNNDLNEEFTKDIDICYFPMKAIGAESIINQLRNEFSIIPIENMPQSEVQHTLRRTKFFIDFGMQPGKDRIPREAIINNCIPILRNIGATKFFEDTPIPDYLKIETELLLNGNSLTQYLLDLKNNIQQINSQLNAYRRKILNEESTFENEVRSFLEFYFGYTQSKDPSQGNAAES